MIRLTLNVSGEVVPGKWVAVVFMVAHGQEFFHQFAPEQHRRTAFRLAMDYAMEMEMKAAPP